MKVPGVRVQHRRLIGYRPDNPGIPMPDMGNVIVAVQILAPVSIPQPNTFTAYNMHGVIVEGCHVWAQQTFAALKQGGLG